jgi:hypothetical protein
VLTFDPAAFGAGFGRQPFACHHDLGDHPLLQLPSIAAMARRLPVASIAYQAGDVPVSVDGVAPHTGLTIEETIRRIETHNSWMVLQNVEQDPEYKTLLHACVDEIRAGAEPIRRTARQAEGFLFVSSARAVTPYHMDPEHAFLLQVHGTKTVTVFDGRNASVLGDEALEAFYAGASYKNMRLTDAALEHARAVTLGPGDGLYIPVTFPHFVEVGDDYSISLSVTFRTPDLARRARVHHVNAFLRRRGLRPTSIGRSRLRDALKSHAGRIIGRQAQAASRRRERY